MSGLTAPFRLLAARLRLASPLSISLALAVLTLAVYVQVWHFEFITIDDPIFVSTNPHVRSGLTLSGIKWAFDRFYFANWIPLTWLSFMLDGAAFDAWAGGYHMTNVILHCANVLLLYHVLKKATGQDFFSAFVAALFAIHPIQAESVAWISERKGVLSIFFGLLSLSAYISYAQQQRAKPFLLSLLFLTCSLMSKQTLVTMPCVLLLLDYWPLHRLSLRSVAEKAPFFAISAVFCVVVMLAQSNGLAIRSLDATPLALRVANATIAYTSYLQKAVVPWNLGVYYPYTTDISRMRITAAIVLLVLLSAAAIVYRRRYPFFTVGWLWFLGTLAPMIGLIQVGSQQMADRYAYFSFIGLYLALAGFVTSRRMAIAVVGLFAVLGFVQVGFWRDTIILARHTAKVTNDNPFVHFILGDALIADNRVDEGLKQYKEGVRAAPEDAGNHSKLGQSLLRFGDLAEARQEFQIALAIDDTVAPAHSGLGWISMTQKDTTTAKREFQRALDADPGDQENYFNLALLSKNTDDFQASIDYCQRALAINDNMLSAHRLIAENLRELQRWNEAAAQLRYILSVEPDDAQSRVKLDEAMRRSAEHPDK
jgi:tetratricopeptide (TPR) repeat protein